jgi:hypothetical protein
MAEQDVGERSRGKGAVSPLVPTKKTPLSHAVLAASNQKPGCR